jgi:hypothetical protein
MGGTDFWYIEAGERERCAITKAYYITHTHTLFLSLSIPFFQLVDSTKFTARSVEDVKICNIYCTLVYAVVIVA